MKQCEQLELLNVSVHEASGWLRQVEGLSWLWLVHTHPHTVHTLYRHCTHTHYTHTVAHTQVHTHSKHTVRSPLSAVLCSEAWRTPFTDTQNKINGPCPLNSLSSSPWPSVAGGFCVHTHTHTLRRRGSFPAGKLCPLILTQISHRRFVAGIMIT